MIIGGVTKIYYLEPTSLSGIMEEKRRRLKLSGVYFGQQYNRHRVSVSKTKEKIRSPFNGLVVYLKINLNLK
jgi:hypothetical protein